MQHGDKYEELCVLLWSFFNDVDDAASEADARTIAIHSVERLQNGCDTSRHNEEKSLAHALAL